MKTGLQAVARRTVAATAMCLALPLVLTAGAAPAAAEDTVTVVITRVKGLDRFDVGGGKPDFFARVTIAGETFKTDPVKQQMDIKPDWKISKKVKSGKHDVKIEIFDKDVGSPSDKVDINRVDNKRDLDFTVDTNSCNISGFSGGYSCGDTITRAGREKKNAEIQFRVRAK